MDLPPVYLDVPAQVQHADHISNHIVVRGGTNWDLSRSAVATPITPLVAPDPIPTAPQAYQPAAERVPAATVRFSLNSVLVPSSAAKLLREQIPKGSTVSIEGRADAAEKNAVSLAKRRASEVAARIKKMGASVGSVTSVTEESSGAPAANRKVDVFVK